MDVMQTQLDDMDAECQKLRKALAHSEQQLRLKVGELSVLEAQQEGALDIKAISHELEVVRAEQEDLARTTLHLREEISVLNENIVKKDLEIRQKDAAYEYLLGRNALLLEQSESNDRLVSSLRAQVDAQHSSIETLYERLDEERPSVVAASTPSQSGRVRRPPPPIGCCQNLFRCLQSTIIVIVTLIIVIGILVVIPFLSIFSGENES